jgi:predicted CXXCH cytochrome family protein
MREGSKWLRLLVIGLLACTLALAGCSGDDGDDGIAGTNGNDGQDFQLPAATEAGLLACSTCHGMSTAAQEWVQSKHAMNSDHTINACATCHNPSGAMFDMQAAFGVSPTGTVVGCEDCHGAGSNHVNLPNQEDVAYPAPTTEQCAQCHDGAEHIKYHPFYPEIASRFETSRHAAQHARNGFCSACHSHQGGIENLSSGRKTSLAELEEKYNENTSQAYLLPVGSDTIVGVTEKQCATCHDPHKAALRGEGDTVQSVTWDDDADPLTGDVTEDFTVFSAEFNLCTTCHMVDLKATFNEEHELFEYELSEAYTAASLVNADSGTYNFGQVMLDEGGATVVDENGDAVYHPNNRVFYHDGASGNGRTFVDTHFGGQILSHLVDFGGGDADQPIKGYNVNAANEDSCTICHDPHTAGKLLSATSSTGLEGYPDILENNAISYAEGLGEFHTDYLGDAMGHGCRPCHDGGAPFVGWVVGGSAPSGSATGTIGCRSCHELQQGNAVPGDNNEEAFAQVREFAEGHEFAFESGAVVDVADLGVNQICFECHKGRVGVKPDADTTTQVYGVSYLHYAPVFATLFGNESQMVPTYADKTYVGKFAHFDGTEFGCVDCHNVHDTNGNDAVKSKMQNADFTCNGCHATGGVLDAAVLRDRTVAYGERLFETILATYNTRFDPDLTPDELETIISSRGASSEIGDNDLAKAASIFKIFNYEEGSPQGVLHGHGGSWAHNSKFARQVQYDAIEDLSGDLTGLARP